MSYIGEPMLPSHLTSPPITIWLTGRDDNVLDLATLECLTKGIIEVLDTQNATNMAPTPPITIWSTGRDDNVLDLVNLEALTKGIIEVLDTQTATNTAPIPQSANTAPVPPFMLPVPHQVWGTSTEAIWYPAGGKPSMQKARLVMEAEERRRQTDAFPNLRGQHSRPKDQQAVSPMKRKRQDEDADDIDSKDESVDSKTGPCLWRTCGADVRYDKPSLQKHLATKHKDDLDPSNGTDDDTVPCRWSNCECSTRLQPSNLGRHIATAQVHGLLAERWKCEWCNKLQSRKDEKARHYNVCEVLKLREEGRSEKRMDERPAKIQRKH